MRPHGTPEQLEGRRRRAIALLRVGRTYQTVAAALNCSISSVVRWKQSHREGGLKALAPGKTPGRPPRLDAAQKKKLVEILRHGAAAEGYSTELWTLQRIVKLIVKYFGVRYHVGHIWRLMTKIGWTWQKPKRRAIQRDEDAIRHWKRYMWPSLKKNRATWGPSRLSRRERVPPGAQRPQNVGSRRPDAHASAQLPP